MQEAILTNVIHFAPIGILALLLIMVLILVSERFLGEEEQRQQA